MQPNSPPKRETGLAGQGQVEYALLLVLVAFASIVGLGVVGDELVVYWEVLGNRLAELVALL